MSKVALQFWESTWPELPARTRLFNLEPIGIGTAHVECITSYITRLAAEHMIPPWFIVSKDIAPRMSRKTLSEPSGHSDLYGKMGASLNGVSSTAAEVVNALEDLTGRADLAELTMQRWRHVLAPTGLLRRYRAWCPICFEEWKAQGKPIYEPLLWTLKETDACVDHFVPLVTQCPKCHKVHGPLTWFSKPGLCPRCKGWLGCPASKHNFQHSHPVASINEWHRYKSLAAGHLVAVRPRQITPTTTEMFSHNIRFLRDQVFEGNVSEFCRMVHHSRFTINNWAAGKQLPQLLSVLFLAHLFRVLPQHLLNSELSGERPIEVRECPPPVMMRVKRCNRKMDREGLRTYLQLTLNANIDPPPSFRRICIKAQIDQGHAANSFPDLARAFMDRYKRYVNARAVEQRRKIVASLHQAIASVMARGEFPTFRRIRKKLEDPNWTLQKWVRIELKRIAAESVLLSHRKCKETQHEQKEEPRYE